MTRRASWIRTMGASIRISAKRNHAVQRYVAGHFRGYSILRITWDRRCLFC